MNRIAELGNKIFRIQAQLGMDNPKNHHPGLTESVMTQIALFEELPAASELHNLYAWRNGSMVEGGVAMGKLWIKPGFYLLPAQESVADNRYCSQQLPGWSNSWYPLMSDGSAGMLFSDVKACLNGHLAIFYHDPEMVPITGQIYDTIELMFLTLLECYEAGAYFLASEGYLDSDFPREVAISRRLNPQSDYWQRGDLF